MLSFPVHTTVKVPINLIESHYFSIALSLSLSLSSANCNVMSRTHYTVKAQYWSVVLLGREEGSKLRDWSLLKLINYNILLTSRIKGTAN